MPVRLWEEIQEMLRGGLTDRPRNRVLLMPDTNERPILVQHKAGRMECTADGRITPMKGRLGNVAAPANQPQMN